MAYEGALLAEGETWAERKAERARLMDKLPEDQREGVTWAVDYTRMHSERSEEFQIEVELRMLDLLPDTILTGHIDVLAGDAKLFDLKWRDRDYDAQMMAYALMIMEHNDVEVVKVHVLFGAEKRAEVRDVTRPVASTIVRSIIQTVLWNDQLEQKRYFPHRDSCKYCGQQLTCPARLTTAQSIAVNYSDALERVQKWRPSTMETGQEFGDALWIVRNVVSLWCDSVEFHALQAAKRGITVQGFELQERKGRETITSVEQAYPLAGIPQEEFLKGCTIRMNTSKRYPDQRGLLDIIAAFHKKPKATAKKDFMKQLREAGLIQDGKPSQSLKQVGAKDEPSEETTE